MSRHALVTQALEAQFGASDTAWNQRPVAGGSINEAALWCRGDARAFVKWNELPLSGQFAAEAAGLHALRASPSELEIPHVLSYDDTGPGRSYLALEYLPPGRRAPGFDEALGRGLAELHRSTDPRGFGFDGDGYCGATPQPNSWCPSWSEFYAEHRLGHMLRLSRDRGLPKAACAAGDRVLARLPSLVGPEEPSALIHGDLWSGNLHVAPRGNPGLVDPAASYSHREAELGMMVMFGGFSERVFAAYDEAYPLAPGWRGRLDLYTLYHVLNHYVLFGGSYGAQAARSLSRYA